MARNIVEILDDSISIVIGESGPQGPKGDPGFGAPSDLGYVHTQSTPASVWTINHDLKFIPNITVVDSAGTVVEGQYEYPNSTTVILTFSGTFAGKAYLS